MRISRRVRLFLYIGVAAVIILLTTAAIIAVRFKPVARDYVMTVLKNRYKSEIDLGDLDISLFPTVRATGTNLAFHYGGRSDGPPLVVIKRFTVEARFIGFFRYPRRIRKLTLEGLEIRTPPRKTCGNTEGPKTDPSKVPFILEEIVADGTSLQTTPKDPQKAPLVFDIRQLTLHHVGAGRPMTFHAELNNAKPPGFIHSDGQFGPWNADDPDRTPVSGKYTFRNADLSVFSGIAGILASDGAYKGQLDRIEVKGTCDVPDFALRIAGHPVHLKTYFQATVDGTDGDTELHPVKALLGSSRFEVSGAIARHNPGQGKAIELQSHSDGGRLEDFLQLAVRSPKPPMTGTIKYETKVLIPPGKTDVVDRLQLQGTFSIAGAKFISRDVQQKVASLSHHAQGKPKQKSTEDVAANFNGRFRLNDATLTLPDLRFDIPGAAIALAGNYKLRSGEIDFHGTARLQATISDMTTGWKHIVLKPVDPLFKRDGAGAVLPINITGTRGEPSFKLDVGRVLKRD